MQITSSQTVQGESIAFVKKPDCLTADLCVELGAKTRLFPESLLFVKCVRRIKR